MKKILLIALMFLASGISKAQLPTVKTADGSGITYTFNTTPTGVWIKFSNLPFPNGGKVSWWYWFKYFSYVYKYNECLGTGATCINLNASGQCTLWEAQNSYTGVSPYNFASMTNPFNDIKADSVFVPFIASGTEGDIYTDGNTELYGITLGNWQTISGVFQGFSTKIKLNYMSPINNSIPRCHNVNVLPPEVTVNGTVYNSSNPAPAIVAPITPPSKKNPTK